MTGLDVALAALWPVVALGGLAGVYLATFAVVVLLSVLPGLVAAPFTGPLGWPAARRAAPGTAPCHSALEQATEMG